MNIPRMIGPGIRLYLDLLTLRKIKKEIYAARAAGDPQAERAAILDATVHWGRTLQKIMDFDLQVEGLENLPQQGPVVFVGNHQSYADIGVYYSAIRTIPFGFVAMQELKKVPGFGPWILDVRGVYIDREDPRASVRAIQEGIDLLEQGYSLAIFPEGHRSRGHHIEEFKRGSLRLATKPGVPVIPVVLDGTADIYEAQDYIKKGCRIRVSILPPIETKNMSRAEAAELAENVEQQIRTEYERIRTDRR